MQLSQTVIPSAVNLMDVSLDIKLMKKEHLWKAVQSQSHGSNITSIKISKWEKK